MIYLFTAIGFPPGGSVRKTCTKVGQRQLYTKTQRIQKTMKKHRIHKIKIHTKQGNKRKKNITKLKPSN